MSAVAAIPLAAPGPLAAPELRAAASEVATFMELLEDELQQAIQPGDMPPLPPPLPPGPLPPLYPWMPLPLILASPREERTAKKRLPARGDKRSGRR